MAGYWWECESCGTRWEFVAACGSKGITHFIWDILLPSNWDQAQLLGVCKSCGKVSLRITYEFPRKNKEVLRVVHMVGLGPLYGSYIPMMWETYPISVEHERWFDFKYIDGRRTLGLNRPAVLRREHLKQLFNLYQEKTGTVDFP